MPLILAFDPTTGVVVRHASLERRIDPGHKKVPKIYSLAVHPTR